MTVTAFAVVDGNNRVVRVSIREYEALRHVRILEGTKSKGCPYRVVELSGECERVERQKR